MSESFEESERLRKLLEDDDDDDEDDVPLEEPSRSDARSTSSSQTDSADDESGDVSAKDLSLGEHPTTDTHLNSTGLAQSATTLSSVEEPGDAHNTHNNYVLASVAAADGSKDHDAPDDEIRILETALPQIPDDAVANCAAVHTSVDLNEHESSRMGDAPGSMDEGQDSEYCREITDKATDDQSQVLTAGAARTISTQESEQTRDDAAKPEASQEGSPPWTVSMDKQQVSMAPLYPCSADERQHEHACAARQPTTTREADDEPQILNTSLWDNDPNFENSQDFNQDVIGATAVHTDRANVVDTRRPGEGAPPLLNDSLLDLEHSGLNSQAKSIEPQRKHTIPCGDDHHLETSLGYDQDAASESVVNADRADVVDADLPVKSAQPLLSDSQRTDLELSKSASQARDVETQRLHTNPFDDGRPLEKIRGPDGRELEKIRSSDDSAYASTNEGHVEDNATPADAGRVIQKTPLLLNDALDTGHWPSESGVQTDCDPQTQLDAKEHLYKKISDETEQAAEDSPSDENKARTASSLQIPKDQLFLPTSLQVCARGRGLRLRSRHAWSLHLDAKVRWSQAAELIATVLVSFGFVCSDFCSGDCEAFARCRSCGLGLPALTATRPQHHQSPMSKSGGFLVHTATKSAASSIRLVVASGALPSKRRALVAGIAASSGTGLTAMEDALAGRALAGLRAAVEESLLVDNLVPREESSDCELDFVEPADPQMCPPCQSSESTPQKPLEEDCDPVFLADLRRAFAGELDANLCAYAKPLDDMVAQEELRAAQLMALLAPAYASARVEIPRPARAPALSSFPLVGTRPAIISIFPNEIADENTTDIVARELLQLARQRRANVADSKKHILGYIIDELQEWCNAEAAARIQRKASAVSARLRNAETHALSLVRTLAEDRKKSKRKISLFTSSASERKFASLFRIADIDGDALFYDCAAFSMPDTTNRVQALAAGQTNRSLIAGRLYVAASGCYWHSSGVLGLGSSQAVVPYFTLQRIEVRDGLVERAIGAPGVGEEDRQVDHVATSVKKIDHLKAGARRAAAVVSVAAAKAVETVANLADERLSRVAFVDTSGRATVFFLPPSPNVPDHARRVVDLLQIAKAVDCEFRKQREQERSADEKTSEDMNAEPNDEIAILERVQKIAEISARNAKLLNEATAEYHSSTSGIPDAAAISALAEKGLGAVRKIPASLSVLANNATLARQPAEPPVDDRVTVAEILTNAVSQNRTESRSQSGVPKEEEAKKRLSNLQAFLEQAHQKEQKQMM